ncbi:MAG: glycoside hydrolase family 31 protein [Chloroflexota bacterium]
MGLRNLIRQISNIGYDQVFRAIKYTLMREWWDGRTRGVKLGVPKTPGKLLGGEASQSGGKIQFQRSRLEVQFLTPDMVRFSWEPGKPPCPYALDKQDFPPPQVTVTQADGWEFVSQALKIVVSASGEVRMYSADGKLIRCERPPLRVGSRWQQVAALQPEACVYGLGERAAAFNLRDGSYRLWNRDPRGGYQSGSDPLYLCVPTYFLLDGQGCYLIFYENTFRGEVRFNERAEVSFEDGMLRYYFLYGTPEKIYERYGELTGRPHLPPRWALGYHQSRWSYMSEGEVRQVVEGFKRHDLPLSAIHLDIDYMHGYRVFTVDAQRFPDLPDLTQELLDRGVRVVTIIDPGVKQDENYYLYREGLEKRTFCTLPNGEPLIGLVWPGWVTFPDFTRPEARSWWGAQYPRLLEMGVSGFWHDMNEPTTFAAWGELDLPQRTQHDMEGRGGDHRQAHNVYALMMNRVSYEALRQYRPETRPWLLTRSGWAGVQRYAWNWTGDVSTSWESLRQTIPTVLGLGLSGIPFTGPDIGGFSGAPDAELYLRWFQMAAFMPFFRTHSSKGTPRREPWVYGEPYTSIVRKFLRLRYGLMPYLYTLAWETSQNGKPIVRPLWWLDPSDKSLWKVDDAFLLGDVIVAPILHAGATSRMLQLPAGRWYSYWDDVPFDGPGQVKLEADLETTPLFVPQGSVIPMEEGDRLILHVYHPTDGEHSSLMYSDDGDGFGPGRLDRFRLVPKEAGFELKWEAEGEYPFPYSEVSIRIHGLHPRRVWMDGKQLAAERMLSVKRFKKLTVTGKE